MPKPTDMILNALQNIENKIDTQSKSISDHGERLAKMETHINLLVGDGQTGTIPQLEDKVDSLNNRFYWASGFGVAISTIIGSVIHFVFPHGKG